MEPDAGRRETEMTAETILKTLAHKHASDVFVPECKTGPTWFNPDLRRMDAWVLRRSWTHFGTIGYEIKVTQGDFRRDEKWQEYLKFCHLFYFVCPWDLIHPDEIKDERVGLYWVSRSGDRLYRKREAIWRDIEIPELIFYHILMSRTVVMRPHELVMMRSEYNYQIKTLERQIKRERQDGEDDG